jgi:hypothetical protein
MERSIAEERQIKRMPTKKAKVVASLPKEKREKVEGLIDAIEASWLNEFMEYIRSPWKMLWPNFIAWIARGFWALVWVAIVITLVWWILSTMISLPLIGKWIEPYVESFQYEFNKYTEATNYKENFVRMEETLRDIKLELQKTPKL